MESGTRIHVMEDEMVALQHGTPGLDTRTYEAQLALAGLRQFQLAALVGTSPSQLSRLRHGQLSDEDASELRARIEIALGLSRDALAPRPENAETRGLFEAVLKRQEVPDTTT